MPQYAQDNEATAAKRRTYYLIYADAAGTPWAGTVTGVKAKRSVNGAAETDSTADIVRIGGAWHYVEWTQAELNVTPGDRIVSRVPAASGRLEAPALIEVGADDVFAAAPTDASIATATWASGTRTLSSFGTLVADISTAVWSAVSRTLTSAGAGGGATAAEVWGYVTRTLTISSAPTAAENATATVNALAGGEGAAARTAIAGNVETQLLDNFAAIPTPPTASTIANQVETQLLDNFAAIVPPTAAAVSTQVLSDLAGGPGAAAREAVADSFLGRALQGGTNVGRTVRQALRALRNRVFRNVGTGLVTITTEDDTTADWTTQTTTSVGAAPVIDSNPT